MPFDVYREYLALKNHFTKDNYDYFKYNRKTRATVQSFYKRRDRFWFEKVSRNKNDKEVVDFFVANFVSCSDPQTLWIGEMIREGDTRYDQWKKRNQSLSYIFKEETLNLFENRKIEEVFSYDKGHPILLKNFLSGKISPETMVIYDRIFLFSKNFDKKLQDPVWETVSKKIKKYGPFLNNDVFKYRKILKEVVLGEK